MFNVMVLRFAFPFFSFRPSARKRLARAKDVVAASHGARTVLLDPGTGRYWGLNEVGSRIWELLEQDLSPDEVVDRLLEEYDAPRDVLAADVEQFLARMKQSKLMREGS